MRGDGAPDFAIIIPIYRQPGLAVEAIASALREAAASDGVVILVNDGCPFAETHALCLEFATAHPDRIDYLRSGNAGLSAARNRGIRHALARFPGVGAIFPLDADNRLQPGAMRRALAALRATGADWVYPDIEKFGLAFHADMSGPYSVLRHLFDNICDAGCLIHRRVFVAGLMFDETMRDGYEDWEFWLRCAAAGLRGAHCPELGFSYRARPASMVADADALRGPLVAGLRRRHRALYAAAGVLRLEHQEAPRFCLIHPDHQQYHFTSVPGASRQGGPLAGLEAAFWRAACHPGGAHFPPFVVLLDRALLLELQRLKLADWLFWQIETLLDRAPVVQVELTAGAGPVTCTIASDSATAPQLVATRFTWLCRAIDEDPLAADGATIRLEAPFGAISGRPELPPLLVMLRATAWRRATDGTPGWRSAVMTPWPDLHRSVRGLLQARGPLARGGGDGAEIAILAPTGPLDAALQDLARRLRDAGWRLRLIVEGRTIEAPDALADIFDVLCLFDAGESGDAEGLVGLLAGCAAMLDGGSRDGLAVMGQLHRRQMVTALAIAGDDAAIDRALAHEHALDLITVRSPRRRALCEARGLPAAKLTLPDDAAAVLRQLVAARATSG